MKNLILFSAVNFFLLNDVSAQLAGNAIANDAGNAMISYNPPRGVNLNPALNNNNSLTPIKADVMINVKATSYVVIFSLTQVGESISETDSLMDLRLFKVYEELKSRGVPLEETHVDFISMIPKYEFEQTEKRFSRTMNEVPSGFEMKKNLHIGFTDPDLINGMITAAAESEIYDLVKVDYNIENMDLVYEQLRKKAEEIIAQKTASYTRMGFTLEAQQYGTTQGSVYPMERYSKYTAAKTGMPKYYAKKSTKEKPVEYNYAEKNSTIYYEKVPYNQFDLVLNEEMVEPSVQFYYNLTVNYKIVLEDVALREKEDRQLDLELRRAQIQAQIKAINAPATTVKNQIVVK